MFSHLSVRVFLSTLITFRLFGPVSGFVQCLPRDSTWSRLVTRVVDRDDDDEREL